MDSIGIVLARSGSTEIPDKNKRDFCGKPLVQWTIEQALESKLDEVVVSSDDYEILDIAGKLGALPIPRPQELADGKHTWEAEQHALDVIGEVPKLLFRLQPTSPLRLPSDIDHALNLLAMWPAVVSVTKPNPHPFMLWDIDGHCVRPWTEQWNQPRQNYPDRWRQIHGAIIAANHKHWSRGRGYFHGSTYGYEMPPERSVDIDSEFDWCVAERMFVPQPRKDNGGCIR